ncbi:MAG: hypothetical protein LIP23_03950 [Planctomycetes bacterium]|nr:hypothetical protein [Planctomycetota bacterium]
MAVSISNTNHPKAFPALERGAAEKLVHTVYTVIARAVNQRTGMWLQVDFLTLWTIGH